jgi:hypothetical protein
MCVGRLKFGHQFAFFFFYLELSSAGFISVNQTKTSFGYVKLGLERDTFGHD